MECIENNITLNLSATTKVKLPEESEELACSGFFIDDKRILAVATLKPFEKWFQIFLHEYNHMKQFIESSEEFEEDERLWEWLEGKIQLAEEDIKEAINKSLNIELDCEKRTAKMIEDNLELEMNVKDYIKKANSYIYFYPLMLKHKKWLKVPPYEIQEIFDIMPDKFLEDYWNVPEEYEKLIIKYCL